MTEVGSTTENLDDDGVPEALPAINPADIRLAAMNLLARREHSLLELRRKLRRRFPDGQLVETQLQRLADENLQSDERFAEAFAWQRSSKGYGPLRVRQEMRERGLTDKEIAIAFEAAAIDWLALAQETFLKKFGEPGRVELKEKARRIRFMEYRGFSGDHYQSLVED